MSSTNSLNSNLHIIQLNINGLISKIHEFDILLNELKPEVVFLSESHLTEKNINAINFEGYNSYHFYRKNKKWGGSSIILKKEIFSTVIEKTDFYDLQKEEIFELVAVEVEINGEKTLLTNIYRSPPKTSFLLDDFFERFELFLSRRNPNHTVFIGGDFNIDLQKDDKASTHFQDLVCGHGIYILNNDGTRNDAVLDNILTNSDLDNLVLTHIDSDLSDHNKILSLVLKNSNHEKEIAYREIKYFDIVQFKSIAQFSDFIPVFNTYDVNDKCDILLEILKNKIDICTTKKFVKHNKINRRDRSWINDDIKKLSQQKKILYRRHKRNPENAIFLSEYKNFKSFFKKHVRKVKINFHRNELEKCNGDSRSIWQLVNKHRGKNSKKRSVTQIKTDHKEVTEVPEIVDVFASHFDTVSKELLHQQKDLIDTISLTTDHGSYSNESNNNPIFYPLPSTSSEVYHIINTLNAKKATGLDSISVNVLKSISSIISSSISDVFNSSVLQGTFPSSLKIGKVIPIYKKGSQLDVKNYRPVTVLPVISKVIERLMYNRLYEFIECERLLNEAQFGFRRSKSTQDAILKFLEKIYRDINENKIPIGICYDLTKAFDSISHVILIKKLKEFGISCIDWFQSYLSNRPNHVVLKNDSGIDYKSTTFSNNIGVPQGSILGPLLFIMYINDAADELEDICQPVLFADDSNATTSVSNPNEIKNEVLKINSCFNDWVKKNGLILNETKTSTLIFKSGAFQSDDNYFSTQDSVRFLGIEIDSDLKFNNHLESLCQKLRSVLFSLRIISEWADQNLMLSTYHALFQSHLCYGILAWGHLTKTKQERILRLQKWAVRIIMKKKKTDSCRSLFSELNILTFPALYIYHVLIYGFNMVKNEKIKKRSETFSYDIRSKNNLCIEATRIKKCENFVSFSFPKYFNHLPQDIKNCSNLKHFKSSVKDLLIKKSFYSIDEFFLK